MTKFPLTHVLRWCSPLHSSVCATSLLLVLASITPAPFIDSTAQKRDQSVSTQEVRVLAPGDIVQRRLDAETIHAYELTINAQQFAQIFVDQKGLDLVLKVELPDGTVYRQIDNPNGSYGPEVVSIVAPVASTYTIKISANNKLLSGDYELRVEGTRLASTSEEMRVTAERLFSEAQVLRGTAGVADEKLESAINKYNEALARLRELGDLREQGYCLTNIARTYKRRAQIPLQLDSLRQTFLDQSLSQFREALSVLRQAGDIPGQAFVLNEAGSTHRDFGDPREAITSYESGLQLRLTLGDRNGLAQVNNNLGLTYSYIGYQPKALEYYAKALSMWRELSVKDGEMNTLVNAAKANTEMGDLATGLSQYEAVLAYCVEELNKANSPLKASATWLKPFALNGIGLVHDTWANADLARANYKEARELFRANGYSGGEADVLDNLGLLHAFLSDPAQALEHFQEALVIRKRLNQPKGWGFTLSNLGLAYTLLGKNEDALQQLNLALPHCERARDMRFMAFTLVRMGMAYVALKEPSKALESYEKAFQIQQDPEFVDRRGQAITLDKMGESLALLRKPAQALEKYEQALERWRTVEDGQGQALSLYGIAKIEHDLQHLTKARDRIEEAIQIVEKLRHRVTGRQLQMTYFADKQDLYALGIDVRMQLYQSDNSPADMEAGLLLSEQARARNLLDLLAAAQAELPQGISSDKAEKITRLQRQISELAQTHFRQLSVGETKNAAVVEKVLTKQMNDRDELLASARTDKSTLQAKLAQPLTPHEVQQLLDENTMVLEYSLGEKRSHLWTITRTLIKHHFLPGRAQIELAARQLGQSLTSYEQKRRRGESDEEYLRRLRQPLNHYRASALKLSRMVLGKVSSQLGDKRLVIVADGALQYIPFEVLPLPQFQAARQSRPNSTALLSKNEIVYQPSASTLALLRGIHRPPPAKTVAVFADPVFEIRNTNIQPTPGVQSGSSVPLASREKLISSLRDIGDDDFTLPRLVYSRKEADAITEVAPPDSWMKAVGFNANRAMVTSPTLKEFGIVHFATHGIVNDKNPELSGIVLSLVNERGEQEEGYLTLHDIYNLDLPVRLVVLSACRTGIGKSVPGEGLLGLTRGFMNAGAQSVVVSLWRVDDEATAELMRRFYRHMLRENKLPPATALRLAKLEMQVHTQERWRDPYYWAGFVLQGDWQ